MTRKDYQLLAAAFAQTMPTGSPTDADRLAQWHTDVLRVSNALASDNARFDRMKFHLACGVRS